MAGPIAFLAPDPIQSTQLIPGSNTPASGGLLFCYQVGSSTKQNTFTDPSASTARTNPIVLDSGGNIPGNGEVWITSTAKFVLAPFNDTDPPSSPYWSKDNYPGINLITAAQVQALSAQSEWVQGSTATFVGVTGFSVVGDQTALYTTGRRVKATVTGGDRFGIVTSAVLSTGSTAVGVTLDSGTLNGGLSVISYGILSTPNGSIPWTQITSTGLFIEGAVTTASLNVTSNILTSLVLATTGVFSTVSTLAGTLTIVGTTSIAAGLKIGLAPASSAPGLIGLTYGTGVYTRDIGNARDVGVVEGGTHGSVVNVIQVGVATAHGASSAGVILQGYVKSGVPTTSDILTGEWALWRDSAASTTRFYNNINGTTMVSSAAFL